MPPRCRTPLRALPPAVLALLLVACSPGGKRTESAPAKPADPARAEAIAFRDRVLAIVAEEFPDAGLEPSVDPWVLRRGDAELHLGNLAGKCQAAGGIDACRGVVRHHFELILASLAAPPSALPSTWAEAEPAIRPQLAPAEYRGELDVVHEPFGSGLIVAFVFDSESSYRFVAAEDLTRWGVGVAEVRAAAFANLEQASREIPVAASEGSDRLLAVEIGDGYDATRLLLPGFRRFAAERLGDSYFAAIPTRDVLVLWSKSASPEFQARVRAQVAESFRGGAYPLTGQLFEAGAAGITPLPQ